MSTEPPRAPLAGVTVIGLEQAIAAPLCTRHLADLGARVIKVEQPGYGDSTRHYDTVVGGLSAHFTWLNHGKESAALDLRAADDLVVLEGMLTEADVLVSNLGPGALDRLGLGVDELTRRFPRLIIVDISGYGRGGPLDHKRAYDLLIQAEAGSCAITGTPGHPAKPGIPVADIGTALYSYSAVLAALYDRERTGRGAVVPVAMLDVVSEMMGFALNQVLHAGTEPVPVGIGSPMIAPYGAYPTSDGQTAVLGTTSDREWRRMTELMGCPELVEDPRYLHNDDRVARRDEVDAIVEQWCATRTLVEIQDAADKAGIGNARLNGVRELAEHPQLRERGRWREIGTPSGPVPALLPPGTARDWLVTNGSVPALGAHTDAIRAEFAPRAAQPSET
ncbi:CaiB/BaiF CoA transferase family protein [Nocardia bhagyanarayanae]|uniref:Crotonobetainyl-CoA:carnitine CoA-transferase CaiB-like acyl-CoA transferase n=1 Tax=Nocardia bhagyanarayanae TaxID=1215925 RepID=A0A543FFH4_9NOCA|nr:CaiB/BaiF CoA-transferase family protein [Nocardia bhagyanarayanae]TQM32615.1 crotonobetainyl-CoA:carnitine CoA-transferase CaiB-like acyl-CoA transferase [Nocardia bhagyanarayanae]